VNAPVESEAAARVRPRDPNRAWYTYAARLLPEKGGRWLDLGCGQAELLELAAARGLAGMGLDVEHSNARACLAWGRPALVANLERPLPFRSGSLDGATLVEVIEHVFEAEALVDELARVIRPGGWLVMTTPNVVHLTYRWRALTGHPPKQEGYHLRFFTKDALREVFERRGFRLESRSSFGKQSLLSKLGRLAGRGRKYKFRYTVPAAAESLLAQHFVWKLRRLEQERG
jgi:SAM-dependent methyltransferase